MTIGQDSIEPVTSVAQMIGWPARQMSRRFKTIVDAACDVRLIAAADALLCEVPGVNALGSVLGPITSRSVK
jgi:hypothetical protein